MCFFPFHHPSGTSRQNKSSCRISAEKKKHTLGARSKGLEQSEQAHIQLCARLFLFNMQLHAAALECVCTSACI